MTTQLPTHEHVRDLIQSLLNGSTEHLKQCHRAVAKVIMYLANGSQNVTLQNLATEARTSQSHLSRLFQQEVGVSPMQFLVALQVERSKLLFLADRNCSVSEAWQASGITNFRSFERAFKQWTGCTRREFKERVRRGRISRQDAE